MQSAHGTTKKSARSRSKIAKSRITVESRVDDFDHMDDFGANGGDIYAFQPVDTRGIVENFVLKEDHANRPIWITNDGTIFLEAFSPLCKEVTEFLIAIAEPVSRPNHIHEYKLTPTSLYAAASVEFKQDFIIKILQNFCKNLNVPKQVEEEIEKHTNRYGKAKLILQQNKYYIEAEP